MSLLTSLVLLQLLVSYSDAADSQTGDYISSSGDGKLPSKCERYAGEICSKFVGNQSVYVKPLQAQVQKEMQMKMMFNYLPDYISNQCRPYALQALCLTSFPLCDLTVNYPKPRMFCQDECWALEQYICVNEFNARTPFMTPLVTPCSKLPSVGSAEYKKCIRLNLTIDKPEFNLALKNKTVKAGETVVLKCKLKTTKLPPTITWFKDGTVIPHGHTFYKIHLFRDSARLKIRRIKVEDSGKYTCHASKFITNISTHSWLTVLPRKEKKPSQRPTTDSNKSSCGYLDTSAVCGAHLQDKKVYFHDSKKQHQHERIIHNALSRSNLSTACYKLATAALCYHMFPSCNRRGAMKHRLCREDCLRVRNKVCKNQLPDIFPVCTDLPKSKSRKGRRCDKLDNGGIVGRINLTCGKYKGNGFCGKYVQNENIYFYDMPYQYQLEQTISVSLKGLSISEKCSRYGIPAMCYHLFPVCSHGKKRSRLCQGECTKLKTDICRSEVSLMKKVNENYVKALFPECPNLPRVDTEEGAHCVELGIPRKVVEPVPSKNTTFYNPSHNCYNNSGADYLGMVNVTVFRNVCISWSIHRPSTGWKHNFCRNPDKDAHSPWCYVSVKGRREYCAVKKCEFPTKALYKSGVESTSLGRTIYVVIAIVAVILLGCITVIVYWKVQNSKENVDNSPPNSAAPFAKCSSTQLTDVRENTSVQSFVLNEKLTRGRVKYVSVISEGNFFRVFRGVLINDQDKPNMDIVIKTLSEDASAMQKDLFRRETSLLCPLQHMNILGLLGISPGEGTEFVVFEYLSEVNLSQFLKQAQNNGKNPSTDILLNIASQIANGMKYLSEFCYVHGDLAARNCLIADEGGDLTVKISLLGIGSQKYPSDYDWLHQENTLFPIRWMSPEALQSFLLTSENDVWSFGVLLWEIFSRGVEPYQQYSNAEVTDKIRALELLQCPAYWPQSVRNLMNNCWTVAPSSRPNFVTIYDVLNHLLTDDVIQEVRV